MKLRNLLLGAASLVALTAMAAPKFSVDRIDPPHWWTGMSDPSLQLQVQGTSVKDAQVSVDYPGVTIDSIARLNGSSNWLYVYLNVSPEAKPGDVKITFTEGKKKVRREFPLLQRGPLKGAQGFTAADVLYMVMPDRFADGDTANNLVPSMRHPVGADRSNLNVRHGGDLKGIADHIDYIDSLGVTALWLNPVLENDMPGGSYHGYATTDYYRIDPRLGSNDEYTALIERLHGRGIKTVMDMIFNHCGSEHPWRLDPPASDWFNFQDDFRQTNYRLSTLTDPYASDYDKKLTTDGWFVRSMPDLNQRNPHLMKYLVQNSIWWIEEAGIDGIRMDTYPYVDASEMGRWNDAVLRQYPDFNIVGECWFTEPAQEMTWQRGSVLPPDGKDSRLPAVMDFTLMTKMRDMAPVREETDPWNGLNKIYDHMAVDFVYPDPLNVLRFLDNHDTERFILNVPDSLDQWKQAVAMILTLPGIPQLYYGTELLMAGDRRPGDGNVRRDVPGGFPGDKVNEFSRSGRTQLQNEAYDFISAILQWRKHSPAMASAQMRHFMPDNGLYLYQRTAPTGEKATVVLNGTGRPLEVDMSRYTEIIPVGQKFTDILTGEQVELIPASLRRTFSPRQILILE